MKQVEVSVRVEYQVTRTIEIGDDEDPTEVSTEVWAGVSEEVALVRGVSEITVEIDEVKVL